MAQVPQLISAMCLHQRGLELVETRVLSSFMDKFARPEFTPAMHGETAPIVGAGLEELVRHNPNLTKRFGRTMVATFDQILKLDKQKAAERENSMEVITAICLDAVFIDVLGCRRRRSS